MRRLAFVLIPLFIAVAPVVNAQDAIPSADEVLKEATIKAGKEHKKVFIIFHASWCGWCRKMEAAIDDPAVKKYFDEQYVIRYLTVYESAGKEKLENPGAADMLIKYKGNDQGIPYWLIFDKNGELLADSKMRPEGGDLASGENSGCPAAPEEVAYFMSVLKRTSSLKEAELDAIEKRFRENESR